MFLWHNFIWNLSAEMTKSRVNKMTEDWKKGWEYGKLWMSTAGRLQDRRVIPEERDGNDRK